MEELLNDYDEVIPIFLSSVNDIDILQEKGYNFIESNDNAPTISDDPMVGFMVRNKK